MSTIDTREALRAHENLMLIADHWTDLRARLRPGGGTGDGVRSGDPAERSPINLAVSDLMFEIETEARQLGHVLTDETTDWAPRTSRMPWLLVDVAERYGHWTAGDDRTALAFCDWAEEYATKVRYTLERPASPEYVGPCQGTGEDGMGCAGELYLRAVRMTGRCRECGREFTRDEQREFIAEQMEARLMEPAEIVRALKIVGHEVKPGTVYKWVQRGRLVPVVDEPDVRLFRLADALALAAGT